MIQRYYYIVSLKKCTCRYLHGTSARFCLLNVLNFSKNMNLKEFTKMMQVIPILYELFRGNVYNKI